MVHRQAHTWKLYFVCVDVCMSVPLLISVLSVTCVSPAPSSVTCFAFQAAAPCGLGERCMKATESQLWKFQNITTKTSLHQCVFLHHGDSYRKYQKKTTWVTAIAKTHNIIHNFNQLQRNVMGSYSWLP